ncbi:MAG: SIMPL domain-containing protein [Muribaculaceae bacterium]|nr:SIMPL domain-containing protein [Muribaculaceae bacterium]
MLVNNIVRGVGKFIPNAQVSIGFTVQDLRPYQLKMLKRAVGDAKEKAEIMAEAAGSKLGKVLEIDYNFSHIDTYSQARNIHSTEEAKESTADVLDITPDDMVISDRVDVVFELI